MKNFLSFIELGISEKSNSALKKLNILKPTPVQKKAIPLVLDGNHIMAQARTGSGKTLAFILPIIEQLKYIKNEALRTYLTILKLTVIMNIITNI